MCSECHNKLIEALLEISGMDDFATRMDLLTGIPDSQNFNQHQDNARTHLSQIVKALAQLTMKTGGKPLKILIGNAKSRVANHTLSDRLEELYQQYEQCPSKSQELANKSEGPSPAYHLCEPHYFDLDRMVQEFLRKVLEGQEVVGFAIPCDYSKFPEIFCKRIEDAFRKEEAFKEIVDIRKICSLKYDSIDKLVDEIKRIKFKNLHRYIFIPMKLEYTQKEFIQLLWQRIHDEFHISTQHILIVMMMGKSNCVFPESMSPLIPLFTEDDAYHWILKVCARSRWSSEHIKAKWKAHMLKVCLVADVLDMESTYTHIDEVRSILQDEADLSFDDFFYLLEKRSVYL
jgi:hypothetical protein